MTLTSKQSMDNIHELIQNTEYVSVEQFTSFVKQESLENYAIESPHWCRVPEQTKHYITKVSCNAFALCIEPVTFKAGEAVAFNSDHGYVNQVQFLGYTPSIPYKTLSLLLSQILRKWPSEQLILVKSNYNNVVKLFSSLGFVRISSVSDSLKQYAYLPKAHNEPVYTEPPTPHPEEIHYDSKDRFYYNELRRLFDFDFTSLICDGWTTYSRDSRRFMFTLTFGKNNKLNQRAFKIDVFDCANGTFVGYNDVHIPDDSDTSFNDIPAQGFPSVIPSAALKYLSEQNDYDTNKLDQTRSLWTNHDALRVHSQYRNLGIASTLERIACDVCKYIYPGIKSMQVCVHFDNPSVYYFHIRNGARVIENGLYRLAYNLDNGERPLIKIVKHTH